MIVVADTGPLQYLILIEHVDVLPALYGRVIIPSAVMAELSHDRTPVPVQTWIAGKPEWLHVQTPARTVATADATLGPGESAAIALAEELSADAEAYRDARRPHFLGWGLWDVQVGFPRRYEVAPSGWS
ncbi:MAG: hypothetical protein AB7P67_04920 [Vicinamibacterales bacterium]